MYHYLIMRIARWEWDVDIYALEANDNEKEPTGSFNLFNARLYFIIDNILMRVSLRRIFCVKFKNCSNEVSVFSPLALKCERTRVEISSDIDKLIKLVIIKSDFRVISLLSLDFSISFVRLSRYRLGFVQNGGQMKSNNIENEIFRLIKVIASKFFWNVKIFLTSIE